MLALMYVSVPSFIGKAYHFRPGPQQNQSTEQLIAFDRP